MKAMRRARRRSSKANPVAGKTVISLTDYTDGRTVFRMQARGKAPKVVDVLRHVVVGVVGQAMGGAGADQAQVVPQAKVVLVSLLEALDKDVNVSWAGGGSVSAVRDVEGISGGRRRHDVDWNGTFRGTEEDPRECGWCSTCEREVYDGEGLEHRTVEAT